MPADNEPLTAPDAQALEEAREWRHLTGGGHASPANWTDSYLLAFARAGYLRLVTFDSALARRDPCAVLL